MGLVIFLMLGVFCGLQANPLHDDTPDMCSLFPPDELVDQLLSVSGSLLKGPLPLPTVRWLHYNFQDGQGYGMENIVRTSEAVTTCIADSIALEVSLGNTEPLSGSYNWTKDYCLLSGKVDFTVNNITIKIILTVDLLFGEKPLVRVLELTHLEGVDVQMSGMGIFSPLVSHLTTRLIGVFQSNIAGYLEAIILDFMNKVVLDRLLNK